MTRHRGGPSSKGLPAAAAIATGACVLLTGGPTTSASWADSKSTAAVQVRGGALTAALSQSGPSNWLSYDTLKAAPGNVVASVPDAVGIIPGREGQRWTYTVTSSTAAPKPSTVRSRISVRIRTNAVTGPWPTVAPYLSVGLQDESGTWHHVPAAHVTAAGVDHTVSLPGTLAPGASRTFHVAMWTDAVVGGVDVPMALRGTRSTTAAYRQMATMANVVTLTQVPS